MAPAHHHTTASVLKGGRGLGAGGGHNRTQYDLEGMLVASDYRAVTVLWHCLQVIQLHSTSKLNNSSDGCLNH